MFVTDGASLQHGQHTDAPCAVASDHDLQVIYQVGWCSPLQRNMRSQYG